MPIMGAPTQTWNVRYNSHIYVLRHVKDMGILNLRLSSPALKRCVYFFYEKY
jgi:hypothetical protein